MRVPQRRNAALPARAVALRLGPGGQAVARLARGERWDAILCDLMMPEVSGMELFDELAREVPAYSERVIFMTGGAFTPQARAFLTRLDRPHLEKPFSEAQLRDAIHRVSVRVTDRT